MLNQKLMSIALISTLVLIFGCDKDNHGQFKPASITLREHGELKELVDEKLIFTDSNGTRWTAPKGTLTDGASVPRLLLSVTDGRWDVGFLKAAVVHDAYCQEDNAALTPDQYHKKPWKSVHRMFYEASMAGGTSPLKAKLMFAAVWLAGPRWGDPDMELQQVSGEMLTRGFTGAKKWIEQNDPSIDEIEADIDRREPVLLNLYKLETRILTALQNHDTTNVRALLQEEGRILKDELEKSPDDSMLQIFKGYWHKNRAILYRSLNRDEKAKQELIDSEKLFKGVIENNPKDPGALNGLGSVAILRNDLNRGERYIRRALEIAPGYSAAKHDLRLIERLRETQPHE